MKPYFQDDFITLYHGDARAILPTLASGSVDFVFTDPPYGHNNNNGDLIHRREAEYCEQQLILKEQSEQGS